MIIEVKSQTKETVIVLELIKKKWLYYFSYESKLSLCSFQTELIFLILMLNKVMFFIFLDIKTHFKAEKML